MPARRFFGRRATGSELPVITEDPVAAAAREKAAAAAPRVPQKSYRRSNHPRGVPPPPPYVPALHLPPRYRERTANALAWNGARLRRDDGENGAGVGEKPPGGGWSRRKRWGLAALVALLLVALIVGLAVGLSVGKKDKNSSKGDDDASDSDDSPVDSGYPAGSFTFNTTLQDMSTSCTSNAAAWNCPTANSVATFSWIITAVNASTYNVSSSENPWAAVGTFANATTSLLDAGEPTERLSFSFDMDKDVVPKSMLTSDNRAAVCTFPDTAFAATLWTRRSRDKAITPPEDMGSTFIAWPGDIEVTQSKGATASRCEDKQGDLITEVKAGSGECGCHYASFDLE